MIGELPSHSPDGSSFLRELARQFRAQDGDGAWSGKNDGEILAPLVVPRHRSRDALADESADVEVFWRIELFHAAVGRAIEARTGVACTPMLKMHHEGYGRVVLLAGRLVVVSRFIRDVSRFGFESLDKLAEAGERLIASGVAMIERFPEAVHHSE
jgi:probable nitrogen fixation protein